MRLIDIYKETAGGIVPVTVGCIQIGETELTKTVQSKFYTLSDGRVCCYPVATAKSAMTLTLECTGVQAKAIEQAAALGSLLVAGMRFGANSEDPSLLPYTAGYRVFPTGSVKVCGKYIGADIFAVTIPLLLDANGDSYASEDVPALLPDTLTVGSDTESAGLYQMTLIRSGGTKVPVLLRQSVKFAWTDTVSIGLTISRADYAADVRTLTGMTATINGTGAAVTVDGNTATVTGSMTLGLYYGVIDIVCSLEGCRTLRIRVPVYRQAR